MPAKKTRIHEPKIYTETVIDPGCWGLAIIIVCVLVLVGYLIYVSGIVAWGNIVACLFSAVVALYFFIFGALKISATTSAIAVRFGIYKRVYSWEDIYDCYTENIDYFTGGIENRFLVTIFPVVKADGKLIFHTFGNLGFSDRNQYEEVKRQVVLCLRRHEIEEFSFSTRKPKALVDVIKKHISDSQ